MGSSKAFRRRPSHQFGIALTRSRAVCEFHRTHGTATFQEEEDSPTEGRDGVAQVNIHVCSKQKRIGPGRKPAIAAWPREEEDESTCWYFNRHVAKPSLGEEPSTKSWAGSHRRGPKNTSVLAEEQRWVASWLAWS